MDASRAMLKAAITTVLDSDVMMYGITVPGIVTAIKRALA